MFKKVLYFLPLALVAASCSNDEPDVPVEVYELRVLTFEDADAAFTPYTIGSVAISTWSDLVDDTQYGGTLLYGDMAYTV